MPGTGGAWKKRSMAPPESFTYLLLEMGQRQCIMCHATGLTQLSLSSELP